MSLIGGLFAGAAADAAVTALQNFPAGASAPQLTATTGNLTGTFTVSAGSNRLLVVTVQGYDSAGGTGQTWSATYGGQTLTQAFLENSNRRQTWIGYLNEAGIAAASNTTLTITHTGVQTGQSAYIATFQGVNQTTPITAADGAYTNNTNTYQAPGGQG